MAHEELLAAYRSTTWRVRLPASTLSIRIGEPAPLRRTGIITAFNPASVLRHRSENRAANRRLLEELRAQGADVHPAVAQGHGPDAGRWREPGFAVAGIPVDGLARLAERFGQNAIVWISETGVPELVVTRAGFAGRAVGARL